MGSTCMFPSGVIQRGHLLTGCLIQNGRRGLKNSEPLCYYTPEQLLLNKCFDLIIPPMKPSKIQNGHQGAPKWPTESGKGSTLDFGSGCKDYFVRMLQFVQNMAARVLKKTILSACR